MLQHSSSLPLTLHLPSRLTPTRFMSLFCKLRLSLGRIKSPFPLAKVVGQAACQPAAR